jgi:hypothetical protein
MIDHGVSSPETAKDSTVERLLFAIGVGSVFSCANADEHMKKNKSRE